MATFTLLGDSRRADAAHNGDMTTSPDTAILAARYNAVHDWRNANPARDAYQALEAAEATRCGMTTDEVNQARHEYSRRNHSTGW